MLDAVASSLLTELYFSTYSTLLGWKIKCYSPISCCWNFPACAELPSVLFKAGIKQDLGKLLQKRNNYFGTSNSSGRCFSQWQEMDDTRGSKQIETSFCECFMYYCCNDLRLSLYLSSVEVFGACNAVQYSKCYQFSRTCYRLKNRIHMQKKPPLEIHWMTFKGTLWHVMALLVPV